MLYKTVVGKPNECSVGERLSYFLGLRALTQADFARLLQMHGGAGKKVSRQRVSNWVNDIARPSLRTMDAIYVVLDTDAPRFWGVIPRRQPKPVRRAG